MHSLVCLGSLFSANSACHRDVRHGSPHKSICDKNSANLRGTLWGFQSKSYQAIGCNFRDFRGWKHFDWRKCSKKPSPSVTDLRDPSQRSLKFQMSSGSSVCVRLCVLYKMSRIVRLDTFTEWPSVCNHFLPIRFLAIWAWLIPFYKLGQP